MSVLMLNSARRSREAVTSLPGRWRKRARRSMRHGRDLQGCSEVWLVDGRPGYTALKSESRSSKPERNPKPEIREWLGPRSRHSADRKSTRLNSSHANISYAVFCL